MSVIYYKDNPDLGIKTVTTFSGVKEYRCNCKRIQNEYFVKNVDCFEVDKKWYRVDSGIIVLDYETKKYILKTSMTKKHINGIVGFDDARNPIFGMFSPNPYNNCQAQVAKSYKNSFTGRQSYNWEEYTAINHLILADNGFVEKIATGIWYDKIGLGADVIAEMGMIFNEINHGRKGYNIEDNEKEMKEKIDLFNKYEIKLSKDVRKYARFLGDTSFGLEIECAKGYLPDYIQNRTGVVICRDGSLDGGPEFVTIPMKGAKGLQNINVLSDELRRRATIDINCSYHVHLGGLPTTRMFLVSLYQLACLIQDDVFKMFPGYKIHWKGVKKKDYNQKLIPKFNKIKDSSKEGYNKYITDCYSKIFSFLTEGVPPDRDYNRRKKVHPQKAKWDRHSRYCWVNLMNMIFSDRNTVEFRLHTPTTNNQRMINWLFICNAIVRYAAVHAREIITGQKAIKFDDVLSYYADTFKSPLSKFLSDYLKAYVKERTELFQKDLLKGDNISMWEMTEDKIYTFRYENVNLLF